MLRLLKTKFLRNSKARIKKRGNSGQDEGRSGEAEFEERRRTWRRLGSRGRGEEEEMAGRTEEGRNFKI